MPSKIVTGVESLFVPLLAIGVIGCVQEEDPDDLVLRAHGAVGSTAGDIDDPSPPVTCIPFADECLSLLDPTPIVDVSEEDAVLIDVRRCSTTTGGAASGCADIEVMLPTGDVWTYTLSDTPCSGVATRTHDWGGQTVYKDPACFAGWLAIKRSSYESWTFLDNDEYNHLEIPAYSSLTQTYELIVQTPQHWTDDGFLGRYVYGGVLNPAGPWNAPAPAWNNPNSGWKRAMSLEVLNHSQRQYGTTCREHRVRVYDAERNLAGEELEEFACSVPSGGSSDAPKYEAQCRQLASETFVQETNLEVAYAAAKHLCTLIPSVEGSFQLGQNLGGGGTAGQNAGELNAEAGIDSRFGLTIQQSPDKQSCQGVVDSLRDRFTIDYLAFLERCLNDPESYFGEETVVGVVMSDTIQDDDQVAPPEDGGIPALWDCDNMNGQEAPGRTDCEGTGSSRCCTERSYEYQNCSDSASGAFMECDCDQVETVAVEWGDGCDL